jgi:hypothetical protein
MTLSNNPTQLELLGAAVVSAQKVEFALFQKLNHLLRLHENQVEKQAIGTITPENVLAVDALDIESKINLYHHVLGNKLAMTKDDLFDFVSQRNIVTGKFWLVTGADFKGGEKLANPSRYLNTFIEKCHNWQLKLEQI